MTSKHFEISLDAIFAQCTDGVSATLFGEILRCVVKEHKWKCKNVSTKEAEAIRQACAIIENIALGKVNV